MWSLKGSTIKGILRKKYFDYPPFSKKKKTTLPFSESSSPKCFFVQSLGTDYHTLHLLKLTFSICLSYIVLSKGSITLSSPRNHLAPIPVSPRLCVDGCMHMLHSVPLQPLPGPVLNLNARGLNVQMVHCNLVCSLDATHPQGLHGVTASN